MLLIVLAATLVVAARTRWGSHQGGPLEGGLQRTSHVTARFALADGEALTWGIDLPRNPTSTEVTLESIEPVNGRGVDVIGIVVSYPLLKPNGTCVSIGLARDFPPAGVQTFELSGASVPSAGPPRCGDQPSVLVGVRRSPGTPAGTIDAVRLRYLADGTHYEILLPFSLELTMPPSTASVPPGTTVPPSPSFAASECTNATVTTRQVIERYFSLSTSNDVQAVTDCFAKTWREKNATGVNVNSFAAGVALWSQAGPATDLDITFLDAVNGCDRYRVAAKMATGIPIGQSGSEFITIGPEAGMPRIFEVGTALVNTQRATTTCR